MLKFLESHLEISTPQDALTKLKENASRVNHSDYPWYVMTLRIGEDGSFTLDVRYYAQERDRDKMQEILSSLGHSCGVGSTLSLHSPQ